MSQRNDGGEALVWGSVIVLAAAGCWLYLKVQAFAGLMHVDAATALRVVVRGALLLALVCASLWTGLFRKLLPYLPCAVFLVIAPALSYWAWNYSDVIPEYAMNPEPAWYGVKWIQIVISLSLFATGFGYQWKSGEYD